VCDEISSWGLPRPRSGCPANNSEAVA